MKKIALFPFAITILMSACTATHGQDKDIRVPRVSQDSWMTRYINPPKEVQPDKIFTFLCESIVQRPTTLTNTCADFGEAIFDIKWMIWSIDGAKGTGTFSVNQCEPDCAEGIRKEYQVELSLDRITFDGKRYFLNYLTIVPAKIDNIDLYEIWDLGSFYREVPEMRE